MARHAAYLRGGNKPVVKAAPFVGFLESSEDFVTLWA
jgi:hypothetical protein